MAPRIVEKRRTGRDGQTATIRGTETLSGQVRTSVASQDLATWVRSRWELLAFALEDAGFSRVSSGRAATVSMVVWAFESGWGSNEWNWNGVGMHCANSDAQCTEFPSDARDPRLRAYDDLAAGVRDFWRVVRLRASASEWSAILAGELAGWAGLWRRRIWSPGSSTPGEFNQMLGRVVTTLRAAGVDAARIEVEPLPEGTSLAEESSSSDHQNASEDVPRRRAKKGVGLLLLAAIGLVAAYGGKDR